MSQPFDMELFLAGVLTGSHASRQRHVRQAKIIQAEIAERWQRKTPWAWKRKHVAWFLDRRLVRRSESTRYYYLLTVRLLARRLEKPWVFRHLGQGIGTSSRTPQNHHPPC
ncbi:hypothetical protein [Pseudomonas viridiflava]|uniref:hypothetical protein n=1 Tax=Pseudomonas viridiflava TaxID=33069 RepID=UPI001FCFC067|nr:hypothetical protein [Pseudomonas viridiflava]